MATEDRYPFAIDTTRWDIPSHFDTTFRWEYEHGRPAMEGLFSKAKKLQWNAENRIDWSQDLDPLAMQDESIAERFDEKRAQRN